MKKTSIINNRMLSLYLTGSPGRITNTYCPAKHQEAVSELKRLLQIWKQRHPQFKSPEQWLIDRAIANIEEDSGGGFLLELERDDYVLYVKGTAKVREWEEYNSDVHARETLAEYIGAEIHSAVISHPEKKEQDITSELQKLLNKRK